jgi:hypothetical protein
MHLAVSILETPWDSLPSFITNIRERLEQR